MTRRFTRRERGTWPARVSYAILAVAVVFPLVMLIHSVFANRELREMRSIYLRDLAATVAARLEVMPAQKLRQGDFSELLEANPSLIGVRVFRNSDAAARTAPFDAILAGHELYRTEEIREGADPLFRAYIPFHNESEVQVAKIDISAAAPDFILVHARHNMLLAVVSGSILLLVSLSAIWSARRAARLEVRHLETQRLAELGALSAALAHEIRNPLGTIKGFAQLAREGATKDQDKPLEAILRETRRLEDLVNSLLLYGRPKHPIIRCTPWEALAGDLRAHFRNLIAGRPIQFIVDSKVQYLSTDPDLLTQALLNLIRNSVESIPDGSEGKVTVRAGATSNSTLVIAVEDDGPGLPEQVRAKLFSPFVTTKASGTGLGLPISKKLAEALGGSLQLAPVEPHGTRAELTFYGTNSGH